MHVRAHGVADVGGLVDWEDIRLGKFPPRAGHLARGRVEPRTDSRSAVPRAVRSRQEPIRGAQPLSSEQQMRYDRGYAAHAPHGFPERKNLQRELNAMVL